MAVIASASRAFTWKSATPSSAPLRVQGKPHAPLLRTCTVVRAAAVDIDSIEAANVENVVVGAEPKRRNVSRRYKTEFAKLPGKSAALAPKEAIELVMRTPTREMFQMMLFSKIVPNCKKLGLLDAGDGWLRASGCPKPVLPPQFWNIYRTANVTALRQEMKRHTRFLPRQAMSASALT